jgi:ribosomal protein S18 acetylase RimI-like enzyme
LTRVILIEPASPAELDRYYQLRWKILRAPWNQPPGSERDPLDENSTHIMAVNRARELLGVGRLHFNSISEGQVRYMAVAVDYQRSGIGSLILENLEHRAHQLGATRIVLDARENAIGFYRKRGYRPTGPGPMLFRQVAHVCMAKRID